MLVIIIVILLLLSVYYYMDNDIVEGLNTFNGRMAIDDQYFYDKLFDDVAYYPNEYEKNNDSGEEIGKLLKTGWMRCKEECPGNCVEYGVHGASYCFSR
jgi:hypothetical protein